MKRVLETNDTVNADILQMNRTRKLPLQVGRERNIKKSSSKWKFLDVCPKDQENSAPSEGERKITEKIINHMKNEIKSNC